MIELVGEQFGHIIFPVDVVKSALNPNSPIGSEVIITMPLSPSEPGGPSSPENPGQSSPSTPLPVAPWPTKPDDGKTGFTPIIDF